MRDNESGVRRVFGASGYIGINLVPYLRAEGARVRATSRHVEILEARQWNDVELIEADALKPETLAAALRGIDTAYYLVHSMAAGKSFPALDIEAAENFGEAAARANVRRIAYLGGLTPDNPRSKHLKSRVQTGDVLRAAGVPVTEIRAGMIIGPGSAAWEVIRDLVNYLPVMVTPRWVKSRSTPIALENLLRYLADVPNYDETAGQIYDVGGAETLTYLDVMQQYGELVGNRPRIVSVGVLTPRLSSYWLRLVTSVPTNIARALIDGLSQDVVVRDHRLRDLIPQRLLNFRESAQAALEADRQHAVPARWVENAIARQSFRPEYSYYPKQAGAALATDARTASLWRIVTGIGHRGDYFYASSLWALRRAFDWLIGGPSFRRRRRHPDELRVGDVVDGWRVIAMEPQQSLTLLMEIKAPGTGVLEFTIVEAGDKRKLSMTAYWHPAGVWGLMYWYAMLPFHALLFRGTVREIIARASSETRRSKSELT